jgi:hypothetical protein
MRTVMVRYRVKPERVEEHEALVRAVFHELSGKAPPGLRYGAYKERDGLSFVHLAFVEVEGNPLSSLESFRAFTERIAERCDQAPATTELSAVGTHGL